MFVALREKERRGCQIGQAVVIIIIIIIELREETARRLHWILRCCITAWQRGTAQMGYSLKTCFDAANENFAAPYAAVIPVARAVEADSHNARFPVTSLCQHRSYMSAMMLDG